MIIIPPLEHMGELVPCFLTAELVCLKKASESILSKVKFVYLIRDLLISEFINYWLVKPC